MKCEITVLQRRVIGGNKQLRNENQKTALERANKAKLIKPWWSRCFINSHILAAINFWTSYFHFWCLFVAAADVFYVSISSTVAL
jgi:hypothetical protein